jgi:hypothetical protein
MLKDDSHSCQSLPQYTEKYSIAAKTAFAEDAKNQITFVVQREVRHQ